MLNIFEEVHNVGFVYNDINLDNLMFDYKIDIKQLNHTKNDFFETNSITLVDFGYTTSYMD